MTAGDADRHYRRWLAVYPRRWREANADVLLGIWLDVADSEGRSRPTAGEVADLVVHALTVRLRLVLPGAAARRAAALIALVTGSAVALAGLLAGELAPMRTAPEALAATPGTAGPFPTAGVAVHVLWLLVLVAALAGLARTARGLAAVTAVAVLALVPVAEALGTNRPPLPLLLAQAWLAVLAAAGPLGMRPRVRGRLAGATAALFAAFLLGGPAALLGFQVDDAVTERWLTVYDFYRGAGGVGLASTAQVAALLLPAGAVAALRARPVWAPAVLGVLPAILLLGSGNWWSTWPGRIVPSLVFSGHAVLLGVLLLPVAAVALDRWLTRRRPAGSRA